MYENPVIIIGMNRSGTSMIVQKLKEMGVFMGATLEVNNEATLFLELNDWLLAQCQGGWYSPSNLYISGFCCSFKIYLLNNWRKCHRVRS